MDVAASATASASPPRRRLPLARLLFVVAGAALFVVAAGYAMRFVSASTFHQERAFRVLDEIGNQLDNLQRTLTNQLRLMPSELAGEKCVATFMGMAASPGRAANKSEPCEQQRGAYARRLALQGPAVGLASVDHELYARACGGGAPGVKQYGFVLRAYQPGAPFTAFFCGAATGESGTTDRRQLNMVGFTGAMAATIENFISQSFFDEVLIALEDGTVVASVTRRVGTQSSDVQVHAARIRRLGVTNVAPMLNGASGAGAADKSGAKSEAPGMPSQPTVFKEKLAGEQYRVFVEVLRPGYAIYVDKNAGRPAVRQERLYLVGFKRDDLRANVAGSIEPGGRFALTILVLLALLIWPLANLRAKSPDEPISWMEAISCLISIVLVPAVLAISAVWVWSYQGVLSWADDAAQTYAHELSTTLRDELRHGRELLAGYRPLYPPGAGDDKSAWIKQGDAPIRSDPIDAEGAESRAHYVAARISNCNPDLDPTCTLKADPVGPANEFGAWSPFSSVFATDENGTRSGLRYTVYDAPIIKPDANYGTREYFRSLQRGQGWSPNASKADSYVAQRIFSGGDGSRVLQMAVPRTCGKGATTQFCGIITGSLSVHSLSASVSPPLLKFAVIDQRSGVVVFHSDDTRSLAENFFVETEHNPHLQALAAIGQSAAFKGYYVGSAHRFYHEPIKDAPWSVVVFYSSQSAGDLPWHAVFTALTAFSGAMLIILAASALALWLWFKRSRKGVRNLAAKFWHRVGGSCSYARWGVSLFGGATALVTLYELSTDYTLGAGMRLSPITWVMWVVLAVAFFVVFVQHRRASHSACIAIWLLLVSAVPAAWMALAYHDVQVQGLLRDSLVNANQDIEARRDVIASDLRRWLSSDAVRAGAFPEPWMLALPSRTMRVPGFTSGSCDSRNPQPGFAGWTTCVFGPSPLGALITRRDLDFWRRETWDAAAQAESQQRRIRLLGVTRGANPECSSTTGSEQCTFRASGGPPVVVRIELLERERTGIADDDARFDLATSSALRATSIGAAFIITWLLAVFASRRLLGVRASGAHVHEPAAAPAPAPRSTVFHTRGLTAEAVEQILAAARPRSSDAESALSVTRVNLATNALYTKLEAAKSLTGPVVLTNLDIALTDAKRRPDILGVLERLVDDANIQILIVSRSSPIERLYHPERFPESGSDHALSLDEALRWDNVLQKLECRDVEEAERPRRHPHLAAVDHHRIWKLCTRTERLLLYQLATDRLANPRNQVVIDRLVARGLVAFDPWPKIVDPDFESFVRTAETSKDLAEWQRDAARMSGKKTRTVVIAAILILALIAVLWFSWTAGDQLKIVSAILAASVAFLSQMGQALNFVRSGSGKST
ncbi:MAG: cache domain-containing protein [Steroidobacter sp.]